MNQVPCGFCHSRVPTSEYLKGTARCGARERDCCVCCTPLCDSCLTQQTEPEPSARVLCHECARTGHGFESKRQPQYCSGCHKRQASEEGVNARQPRLCFCQEYFCPACMITREGFESMCSGCFSVCQSQGVNCPVCQHLFIPTRPSKNWARTALEICRLCRKTCCTSCSTKRPVEGSLQVLCSDCKKAYSPWKEFRYHITELGSGFLQELKKPAKPEESLWRQFQAFIKKLQNKPGKK